MMNDEYIETLGQKLLKRPKRVAVYVTTAFIIHHSSLNSSFLPTLPNKLVFLVLKQDIEGGHAAVAAGDVLLEVNLVFVVEFFVGVDGLFEHAQAVAHHDDLVKKRVDGYFFRLNAVGRQH